MASALVIVCSLLLGGCSVLASGTVKESCTRAPPVIDSIVAGTGLTVAFAATRNMDDDAEAHGEGQIIHMFLTLPALVAAFSAIYGFTEANECDKRADQRLDFDGFLRPPPPPPPIPR